MAATATNPRTARAISAVETLLTDRQRRIVLSLFAAGLSFLLVGLVLVPHGVVFWLAFALLPPVAAVIAAAFGGERARGLDAWFRAGGAPTSAPQAVAAAALPEATRAALLLAAVPAVLAELHRAAATMPMEQKRAADRLLEAAAEAWNGQPAMRPALARDLPQLVAGVVAGGADGVAAAEEAAIRFAPRLAGRP